MKTEQAEQAQRAEQAEHAEQVGIAEQAQHAEMALYRASMYKSAAAAFMVEPTASVLQEMVEAAVSAGEGGFVRESERCLLAHLRQYAGCNYDDLRTRVATEYAELFVGPRPPLAPLYESVYVGAIHRLNTDVTMQVRSFYEKHGLEVVKRNTVPNDHVGFELEFMAHLCDREAAAWDAQDVQDAQDADAADTIMKTQLEFLSCHLGEWVDAFAARIAQAYCADYYDAWARFVQTFVKEDIDYLKQSLDAAVS